MVQQNNMRPQIPAGIAQSPQFAAARSITQEGLPAAFKQLLEDEITFKAMELLDGSANAQAMGELPSPDSVRTQTREGLMSMLGSIGPGIQQQGSQMAQAQQQGQRSMQRPQTAGQFASGGIVGFAKGGMKKDRVKTKAYRPQSAIPVGNSNQPIPMLMQKYGTETVTQFIAEQKALDAKARALAEAGSAAGSMQIEDHKLMKEIFSEKYRDILNESMGMAGGGIVGYADGRDVDPTLYDEMGKQYLPGQPLPEGWQTLTNAPRKIQLPFNPAGEDFAEELRGMERTRRERSTRTIPEFLSDFTFSRSNTAREVLRSPLPALLQSLVDSGSLSNQEAVNELQKILSGPKGMGQRGRWNRENPNFAPQLKAMKEAKERVLDGQEEGMAGGGIVGFQDGGRIKRFQGLEGSEVKESGGLHPFSFVNWALGKGIDLTVLGAQEVAALAAEFSNTEVGQNQRGILGEVASGAAKKMMDAVPDTAMSQGQIGAREAQLESNRGGISSALSNLGGIFNSDDAAAARQELQQVMQGNNSALTATADQGIAPSMSDTAADLFATERSRREGSGGIASGMGEQPAENKGGIMNALRNTFSGRSQEEIDYRERANQSIDQGEFINEFAESDKFGAGLVRRIKENPGTAISTLMMAIPVGGWAGAIGIKAVSKLLPYIVKHPGLASFLTGSAAKLPWEKVDIEGALSELGLGEDYEAVKETLYSEAFGEDPMRPPTDTATSIIETGPTREEIAANVGRKPEGGFSLGNMTEDTVVETPTRTTETVVEAPAENGMPAIDSFDSEVTTTGAGTADSAELGTFLADSVAGNISTASAGYQAKLDAAIARQDDPLQAISTFLRAMGEGDTIGEGMQLAGKALDSLRRSNDAEQIALLQLLETGRISEQDFQLKRLQIQNEKDQIIEYRENSKRVLEAAQGRVAASVSAALMGQYQDVFQDVADREAMSQTLLQQAENEAAREVGGVPRFGGINKLNKDPAFTALVNTKLTVLMENAIAAQLQKASRYAGRP